MSIERGYIGPRARRVRRLGPRARVPSGSSARHPTRDPPGGRRRDVGHRAPGGGGQVRPFPLVRDAAPRTRPRTPRPDPGRDGRPGRGRRPGGRRVGDDRGRADRRHAYVGQGYGWQSRFPTGRSTAARRTRSAPRSTAFTPTATCSRTPRRRWARDGRRASAGQDRSAAPERHPGARTRRPGDRPGITGNRGYVSARLRPRAPAGGRDHRPAIVEEPGPPSCPGTMARSHGPTSSQPSRDPRTPSPGRPVGPNERRARSRSGGSSYTTLGACGSGVALQGVGARA